MTDLSPKLAEFLDEPNIAIFTTLRKDGSPHQTAVWYAYVDGAVKVSVTDGRIKTKHLARDPRVSLAVASQSLPYLEVVFEGEAEVSAEGADELFRELAVKYYGEADGNAYADYDRDHADDRRLIVTVRPRNVRAWDFELEDDYHRPWTSAGPVPAASDAGPS
jgi:PPOX class probable F420-dependent enzyme